MLLDNQILSALLEELNSPCYRPGHMREPPRSLIPAALRQPSGSCVMRAIPTTLRPHAAQDLERHAGGNRSFVAPVVVFATGRAALYHLRAHQRRRVELRPGPFT